MSERRRAHLALLSPERRQPSVVLEHPGERFGRMFVCRTPGRWQEDTRKGISRRNSCEKITTKIVRLLWVLFSGFLPQIRSCTSYFYRHYFWLAVRCRCSRRLQTLS